MDETMGDETEMATEVLAGLIRDVADFPRPGIVFKDITPLLADADGFALAVRELERRIAPYAADALVAIEARGFLFGAALAVRMGLPLQLARKPGKLPADTVEVGYALEYGQDRLEMHEDAIVAGKRYAVVDDLIATGGTAAAVCRLIAEHGGVVACCGFLIELAFLDGRAALSAPLERVLVY